MKIEHKTRIDVTLQSEYAHRLGSIIDALGKYEKFEDYSYEKFGKFIGYPSEPNFFNWIVDIDNPEIQKIIDMIYYNPKVIPALAGPHGATVLKVLLIQNGEKHENGIG